ncbi:MAG: hypothetical protein OIF40_17010 [Mangrovicoccus sp.]|nr:hypothetical protein [Mangrovicoccus sp.]
MFIGLALTLGVPLQNAGDEAPPSQEFLATLTEFSRDQSIFDSDTGRGNNRADIPLKGSSNAPDGAVIETRILHGQSGAEILGWADTGIVTSGLWTGQRPVARSAHWLRAEARVKGSAAPAARAANRFGVGVVIFVEDQSNTHQGLKTNLDEAKQNNGGVIPVTIGNAPGDFQVFWLGDDGDGLRGPVMVSDANKTTTSLAAMAETFAKSAPGLKVMIGFDTLSGSQENDPLNDADPDRSWANSLDLANALQADGSAVGLVWSMHAKGTREENEVEWYAGAFFASNPDGTRNPDLDISGAFPTTEIGNLNVNHVWPEAYPDLLTGRAQFIIQEIHNNYAKEIENNDVSLSWYELGLLENFADRVQFVGHQGGMVQPSGDPHWDKANLERGMPEKFRWMAVGMMRAGGAILDYPLPQIDHIHWTPEYLELWSDAGPITTGQRLKGQSRNFPLDPSVNPPVEGLAQVLGFSDGDLANIERVEITDASGAPAMAGRLRIYPNGPAFTGTSRVYYMLYRSGYQGIEGVSRETYTAAGLSDHIPVVDIGVPTVLGHSLQAPFNSNHLNEANTLSAGEPIFTASDGDIETLSAVNFSGNALSLAARFVPGQKLIFSEDADSSSQWRLRALSDGVLDLSTLRSIKFTSAPGVIQAAADGFCELLVKLRFEPGQERAEIYVNGTPLSDPLLFSDGSFSGAVRGGRKHRLLRASSGDVAWLRQWRDFTSGPTPPSSPPFIEMRADPAGAFAAPGGGRYDVLDNGTPR